MNTQNTPYTPDTLDAAMIDSYMAELQARQLRAQAVSDSMQAFAGWIARRWSAFRGNSVGQTA